MNHLLNVADQFSLSGAIVSIEQIKKGYINETYKVVALSSRKQTHKYILQRINTNVFPDVEALMGNYKLATAHLSNNLDMSGKHKRGVVQRLRTTKDGKLYFKDSSGVWRMMTYFDNVYSVDIPENPQVFYYAGISFGRFIKSMSSVDPRKIKEVIPNFHNTKSRYQDLEFAILRDSCNRVKNVTEELSFIRKRTELFGKITDALEGGVIPTRICHNDCNLNNILFSNETNLPVAIIDLDTVMLSTPLYDFGDSMRSGTNTAKDDEKDLSKVNCSLDLYEAYARGYLEACGDILEKEELRLLPFASLVITAEDAIRFLTDYVNGDTYYHTDYAEQNLDRCRTQLKLLEDMENKLPDIRRILQNIYDAYGLKASVL